MKNYRKMVEDYPSDLSSEGVQVIPMQTMNNPLPPQISNNAPFYNQYHYPQNINYPPVQPVQPMPAHQNNARFVPPVPLPPQQYPPVIEQPPMIPVRIPNYAHNATQPIAIVCPCCKQMVITQVVRSSGKATYISALILCAIQPLLALIPLCSKKRCKDVKHFCPNCGMNVGEKKGEICQK